MNMKTKTSEKQIANVLKVLGSPFRVKLLYAIGRGEVCVCHLEAVLKKRQAYISQHLMVLRDAEILETRREGKYIFYRIADESVFELFTAAAGIHQITTDQLPVIAESGTHDNCQCPKCEPESAQEALSK